MDMENTMSQVGFIYQSMATVAQASVSGLYANIDAINQVRQQLIDRPTVPVAEAPAPVVATSSTSESATGATTGGRVDISV